MVCLECGCDTYVIETRERPDKKIKRRRECRNCGCRFNTVEVELEEFDKVYEQRSYEYCFLNEEYTNQNCRLCPFRKRCLNE